MYPRNAASPERIAVGAVVQISDGAVQTSGCSVSVLPQGGASAAGGGTISYENGVVCYLPTQAETNYTSFVVVAYKTGCIPASTTIVTSASATAGYAGVDWGKITSATATVNLSGTTVKTLTDAPSDSSGVTTLLSRVSSARAGYLDNLSGGAVALASGVAVTSIGNGVITALSIAASALNGKGDWLLSSGYTAPLDAAGTRTALGMSSANMDTQLSAIAGYIDTEVGAIYTRIGAPAGASIAADVAALNTLMSSTGVVLTAAERNATADAFLNRNVAGGSSTGRLVKEALYPLRNKWTVSGGTYTVYQTDDATVSWTSSVTGTAGADPITAADPA